MKDLNLLLEVPLFQQLIKDPNVKVIPRGIDALWKYSGFFEAASMDGFNPFENAIFTAKNSSLFKMLNGKKQNVRKLNFKDRLVNEFLFMLHDYLHVWSYQKIAELVPQTGFGRVGVNPKNIDDFAFIHLLSEAVATVGLDYWYLAAVDFPSYIGMGSQVTSLTVNYHTNDDQEFRRFNSKFSTQKPEFFTELMKFYCSGSFFGFDINSLVESPKTFTWLNHEISYSKNQRIYSREWMNALSNHCMSYTASDLAAPLDWKKKKWRIELIKEMSQLLWEKIKLNKPHYSRNKVKCVYPKKLKHFDSRMMNLNKMEFERSSHFDFHYYQMVARIHFKEMDAYQIKILSLLKERRDIDLCKSYLKSFKKIRPEKNEPEFIFLLG